MPAQILPVERRRGESQISLAFLVAFVMTLLLSGGNVPAQTLKLKFSFDDAGPDFTTSSDTNDGGLPVTLNMETQTPGTGVDLHGAAGSGIQGQGRSLNQSTNNIGGNAPGTIAFVTNNASIGSLGAVTNFTAAVWFKLVADPTNRAGQFPCLFIIGANNATSAGHPDSISLVLSTPEASGQGTVSNSVMAVISGSDVALPLYFPLPTGVWQFVAITYDSANSNACMYYGTEASPAKLMTVANIGAQTIDFGASGTLQIGNRLLNRSRAVPGWVDEFRFYIGAANADFIENIRRTSCPVIISDLTPDGSSLMEGTNTLSFTASSAGGIDTNAIKVAVNGVDISPNLSFGGTSNAVTVSYSGLPVNLKSNNNVNLNGVTIGIRVTDAGGIVATNLYTYDAFSPANYIWEGEDYDFNGGQFIDNPRLAFVSAADTYWQRTGTLLVDYDNDGSNLGRGAGFRVYRGPADPGATEFSLSTGINGGVSPGELMRQKVLDALALDSAIREVDVTYFFGGTGADLPNWMNYTRTYPAGVFYVYLRTANGASGTLSDTLSQVTSGFGATNQTTTDLGTFTSANTGGWQAYSYVPLRDGIGNLAPVSLGGVGTLRLTSGAPDSGNINFLMLVPAAPSLTITIGGSNVFIWFQTQYGSSYQMEYKSTLTDPAWTVLGNSIAGDGTIQSVTDSIIGTSRFYRLRLQ